MSYAYLPIITANPPNTATVVSGGFWADRADNWKEYVASSYEELYYYNGQPHYNSGIVKVVYIYYSQYNMYSLAYATKMNEPPYENTRPGFFSGYDIYPGDAASYNFFTGTPDSDGILFFFSTASVTSATVNPLIPVYNSEQEARAALKDGEWDYDPNPDPYAPGGTSGNNGGDGDFDDDTDIISVPSVPSISASDAGFITLYNPTLGQIRSLASYMWSDPAFDLTTLTKLFADPMDVILGLSILPVNIPHSGSSYVKVGNITTTVEMNIAASQFIQVDCGTINIKKYWGAYLDFSPYTKLQIFLPFIGIRELNVDDVMGTTIQVIYNVDILSGACVAFILCGGSVKYEYIGQCSMQIPLTSVNYSSVISGVLSIAGAVGSTIASGGANAPSAIGTIASEIVNDLKPSFERSGNVSGAASLLGNKKPFLLLQRPNQCLPEKQNKMIGYPSYVTKKIGDLVGYNEIDAIRLTKLSCTQNEYDEIIDLLKGGVII